MVQYKYLPIVDQHGIYRPNRLMPIRMMKLKADLKKFSIENQTVQKALATLKSFFVLLVIQPKKPTVSVCVG